MSSTQKIHQIRNKHFIKTSSHYYEEPLELVRAQGMYVYDQEGRAYLDGIGGIVCISSGHNHPRIKAKIKSMLDNDEIQHTSTLYYNNHVADLAQELIENAPLGLDRVAFTNSGSEANELAFLAARQATGESFIINLRHSYHGGTSGALAQCGHSTWRFKAQPVASATSALEPYCYRCPFGQKPDSCNLECAQNVEATIQTSTNGKLAAFIAEPVMGVGGFISPPNEYFQAVSKIVKNYGGKYISDEVQTGAGRCGSSLFLTSDLGIQPDIITMAKGLANGAPMGAVLMSTELSDSLAGKFYFNTFGGDPYQSAQALMNLQIIKEEKLIANAQAMGKLLKAGLEDLMKSHVAIGDVRGRGLLLGIELVKDRKSKEPDPALTLRVLERCRQQGLLIGKGSLRANVIRLAPPLLIDESQVQKIISIIDYSLISPTE
jgi:4-aminobutyrate aminotransferase-like enzyme